MKHADELAKTLKPMMLEGEPPGGLEEWIEDIQRDAIECAADVSEVTGHYLTAEMIRRLKP